MIVSLLTLSSCSNKPQDVLVETIYRERKIPYELLKVACVEKAAGETVRSLAGSWVNNTSCLRAHQKLVEGLIKNYSDKGATDEQPIDNRK